MWEVRFYMEFCEPEEMGFNRIKLEQALDLVERNTSTGDYEGVYPGAVVMIIRKGNIVVNEAYGYRSLGSKKALMTTDTIFDLASITKPVATTSAFLRLLEMGEVKVDDPIGRYLPELKRSEGQKITMFHLLTHTSGLPGWLPTYIHGDSRDELIRYVLSLRSEYEMGTKVVYSCMGFIILGLALERILGYDFSEFLRENIFEKLQMEDTRFYSVEECKSPERLAPTGERSERLWAWLTKNNLFLNKHIDGKVAFGSVNDENAIALGGISGNAGLYSTAADLSRFAIMYLNGGLYQEEQVLTPTSIKLATTNYTEGKGDNRGLGWLLKGPKNAFGNIISDGAYGHTGFTGTGLWVDPIRELVIILLTNRVHMMKNAEEIHNIRPQFVNAVVSSIIKT